MSKEILSKSVAETWTLAEAEEKFTQALELISRTKPSEKIYYVIGTVTSDGPEYIERNLKLLKDRSENVSNVLKGTVFSAADIFNNTLFDRFDAKGAVNQDYLDLWEHVLKTGYITDIVRTPGWEKSGGASHENRIAKMTGIAIHDYSEFVCE